jgi:transcriptional regulator with XRE-family HTH domain
MELAIRRRQGVAIKKVRLLRGMAIAELAERVGVTPSAVSHWENGRWSPRQAQQVKIARALEVPWSTLFDLDAEASI